MAVLSSIMDRSEIQVGLSRRHVHDAIVTSHKRTPVHLHTVHPVHLQKLDAVIRRGDRLKFLANELMFMFAICRRPSVRLSSVTFVHPTQAIKIFGNISTPFGTLAICDPSVKIYGDRPRGSPPSVG